MNSLPPVVKAPRLVLVTTSWPARLAPDRTNEQVRMREEASTAGDNLRGGPAGFARSFSFPAWARVALVVLFGVLAIAGNGAARADGYHYVGCGTGITLPRTVTIGPGVDTAIVRSAMAEWNQAFGPVFVEAPAGDVTIVADSVTWVEMPCTSTKSVIHAGTDVDLNYWMAHELGHTLGLADHIRSFDDPSIYVNPGRCPDDGYVGIMSYCTPRVLWFGPQDVQMMQTLWPEPAGPVADATTAVSAAAPATDAAGLVTSVPSAPTLTVRGVAPALAAGFPALPASVQQGSPEAIGTESPAAPALRGDASESATQPAGSGLQPEVDPGQPPVAEAPPASAFSGAAGGATIQQSLRPSGKSGEGTDDRPAFFALFTIAIVLGIGVRVRIAPWAPTPTGK